MFSGGKEKVTWVSIVFHEMIQADMQNFCVVEPGLMIEFGPTGLFLP